MYMLHARLPAYRKKLRKSQEVAKEIINKANKPFVSVSWGKDSIVVAHLLWEQYPDIQMIWSDRGEEGEYPETYDLVERWKEEFGISLLSLKPEMSMFEIYRKYGVPEVTSDHTRDIVKNINLVQTIDRYAKENNYDGRIMGLRIEESRGRAHLGKLKGPLFYSKTQQLWICNPIIYWTARDVWAYIVTNDLPYHPLYDQNQIKNREEIRLSNWSGVFDFQNGRVVELKMNHPELFEKIAKEFPEVGKLV